MNLDRVAELQRWQDSGAVWEVITRKGRSVTIGLLRCDGGEEVDRFTLRRSAAAGLHRRPVEQRGMTMELGKLTFVPAGEAPELVAEPVRPHLRDGLWVSAIDPDLADTAAFCEHYDIGLDISANCVVVEARRAERVWFAACVVLATTRADVNGIVRKHLGARKISFAPMDSAVSLTGMEYGGITPVGLPADWPILIDLNVVDQQRVIIGSGVRGSKLLAATRGSGVAAERGGAGDHEDGLVTPLRRMIGLRDRNAMRGKITMEDTSPHVTISGRTRRPTRRPRPPPRRRDPLRPTGHARLVAPRRRTGVCRQPR